MATGNIGKIKASRVNNVPNVDSYIGEKGILFYNYANGVIRMSDGITPGGVPIPYTVASDSTIGGIKAGPGANISADGSLTIDTAGLPLSIGNLSFADTTISTLTSNTNLNLVSNGTGQVNLVGNVHIHGTGDWEISEPIFSVSSDGQVKMLVPDADMVSGAFEIIGNDTGEFHPPNQTGVIMHVTGNQNLPSRFYHDANNNYSVIVGRRYNGNVALPTPVLANEVMFRIASQGYTANGFQPFGPARIEFLATQDQAVNAQGGNVIIYSTPNNTSANNAVKVASFDAVSGITLQGNLTPTTDNTYYSGTQTKRWKGIYAGNAGVHIQDTVTGLNSNVTVTNGIMYLNGVAGLSTGNLYFENNSILSLLPNVDIVVGNVQGSDTGNILLNRVTNAASDVHVAGNITATANITSNVGSFTQFHGKYIRNVRDAGTISDGGNLTIDLTTDAIVYCTWGNGMTMVYTNFTPGSIVKVMAKKAAGTGTDTLNLDGVSANQTSSGGTTISAAADTTVFLEVTSTSGNIGGVYIKT